MYSPFPSQLLNFRPYPAAFRKRDISFRNFRDSKTTFNDFLPRRSGRYEWKPSPIFAVYGIVFLIRRRILSFAIIEMRMKHNKRATCAQMTREGLWARPGEPLSATPHHFHQIRCLQMLDWRTCTCDVEKWSR